MSKHVWVSDTLPQIGDRGQVEEHDAEVVRVDHIDQTVEVLVFDQDDDDYYVIGMPYRWG